MPERRWAFVAGVAAAIPSALWSATRPGLLIDDWSYAAGVKFAGAGHVLWSAGFVGNPRRPVAGLWYALVFGAFGTHPLPLAITLTLLNGITGTLVFLVARRLWGVRAGVFVALAWAALPNRGSSRLWFSAAPTLLAVAILLTGILVLMSGRPAWATAVLTLAVLSNEAVVLLAASAAAIWVWTHGRDVRRAGAMAVPPLLAAAYLWARSPKRETPLRPFDHAGNFVAAQLGRGMFGSATVAAVGGTVVLVAVALVAARAVRRAVPSPEERVVLQGAAILILASAPLVFVGFQFATDGIFDRGNVAPDLGTAVLFGGMAMWLAHRGPPLLGVALAVGGLGYLASLNRVDLADYRRAVAQGSVLEAHLVADVPRIDAPLLIGPPLPATGGVAEFLTAYDASAALRIMRGNPRIQARMACTEEDFDGSAMEPLVYNRLTRKLERRPGTPFDLAVFGNHC